MQAIQRQVLVVRNGMRGGAMATMYVLAVSAVLFAEKSLMVTLRRHIHVAVALRKLIPP